MEDRKRSSKCLYYFQTNPRFKYLMVNEGISDYDAYLAAKREFPDLSLTLEEVSYLSFGFRQIESSIYATRSFYRDAYHFARTEK